jgi:hypothetical protein
MRNLMIKKLEELIQSGEKVTRLFYDHNGKQEHVENYSAFANEDYMTTSLRNSLTNGKSLTKEQQMELNQFKIDKVFITA